MSENRNLLAEYAAGSEAAFREIVSRYIDLVYSAALRLVNGDSHLAEDVAQTVFLDLARAAGSLSNEVRLGGWLHRHTCFVASKTMRSQRRRQIREQEAAQMSALEHEPNFSDAAQILDAAINQLGAADRAAILLRFFEGLDFRAVGQALGSNEGAAQKRVSRALEKLNRLLTKQGVTYTAATLAATLSVKAVSAAPVGLASNIATSALLAAPESASAFSLIKLMTFSKTKAAAVALLLAVSISAPILLNRPAQANISYLEKSVAAQTTQLLAVARENHRLEAQLQNIDQTAAREREEFSKLSTEATALRVHAVEEKSLRAKIHQLNLKREHGNDTTWQNAEFWRVKEKRIRAWTLAFLDYARAHDGQLPATFEDAEEFWPKGAEKGSTSPTEEYEILYRGSLNALTNVDPNMESIIFRERRLAPMVQFFDYKYNNKMGRYDAVASGDTQWGSTKPGQLDSEFNSYEKEHLLPPGAQ